MNYTYHRVAATLKLRATREETHTHSEVFKFSFTDAGTLLKRLESLQRASWSSLRLINASASVHERSSGSHASHTASERHYFYKNLCRRAAVPHERCITEKILRGLWGH